MFRASRSARILGEVNRRTQLIISPREAQQRSSSSSVIRQEQKSSEGYAMVRIVIINN